MASDEGRGRSRKQQIALQPLFGTRVAVGDRKYASLAEEERYRGIEISRPGVCNLLILKEIVFWREGGVCKLKKTLEIDREGGHPYGGNKNPPPRAGAKKRAEKRGTTKRASGDAWLGSWRCGLGRLRGVGADIGFGVGWCVGVGSGVLEEEAGGADCAAEVFPFVFIGGGGADFLGDCGNALEQEPANVGDEMGLAGGNAIIGHEEQQPAEGEIDAGGSAIVLQRAEEIFEGRIGGPSANSRGVRAIGGKVGDAFGARVEEAVGGVVVHAVAAAAASGGIAEVTAADRIELLLGDAPQQIGASGRGPRVG